jgi:hypothetical protein
MLRRLIPLTLLLFTFALFAQEVNLSGSWQVYQAITVSRYSLREHQSSETLVKASDMALNSNGTVNTDVPNLTVQKWQMDEGFLMFETDTGNLFYYPRILATNAYLLVQVDVLERNEQIISITSKPLGNLIIVRK